MEKLRGFLKSVFSLAILLRSADGVSAPTTLVPTPPLDLNQSYQAALSKNEVMGDQHEQIFQSEERYSQAKAGLLPTLSLFGSYTIQEEHARAGSSSISPNTQPLVKFAAAQPIFRGFREFALLRQADQSREASALSRAAVELALYDEVVQSYYRLLSAQTELQDLEHEITLHQKRLKELGERVQIGRSRLSEKLASQTSVAQLEAQREVLLGQIATARESFAFATGISSANGEVHLRDTLDVPSKAVALDDYLSKIETRPDVCLLAKRTEISGESMAIAKGAHWPSVDFLGNYYLKRFGVNENVNWDLQVAATLPLFNGGAIASKVRETASQREQSELALARGRRLAEQDIRTRFQNYVSSTAQLKSLKQALALSEKNYQTLEREYRLGLVTNLEVLQTLTNYQSILRSRDRALFEMKQAWVRLELSAGRKP